MAGGFNVGTLQCSPRFQFRKLNRGGIEIGFGDIAIDLPQARLWITSRLPTIRELEALSRDVLGTAPKLRTASLGKTHRRTRLAHAGMFTIMPWTHNEITSCGSASMMHHLRPCRLERRSQVTFMVMKLTCSRNWLKDWISAF